MISETLTKQHKLICLMNQVVIQAPDLIEVLKTALEGNEDRKQERQVSVSTGETLDDVRFRTRMSIADDLTTMARVGGHVIYYTGQGIGQGMNKVIEAYCWMNGDYEGDDAVASSGQSRDDDVEPSIDEEVYERTQGLMRRGASRSRSPSPQEEEQPSGSSDAIRLLRRGASRSRS